MAVNTTTTAAAPAAPPASGEPVRGGWGGEAEIPPWAACGEGRLDCLGCQAAVEAQRGLRGAEGRSEGLGEGE